MVHLCVSFNWLQYASLIKYKVSPRMCLTNASQSPLKILQLISVKGLAFSIIVLAKSSSSSGGFYLKTTHTPPHLPLPSLLLVWFAAEILLIPLEAEANIICSNALFLFCSTGLASSPNHSPLYFQSTLEIPLILPCSEMKSTMSFHVWKAASPKELTLFSLSTCYWIMLSESCRIDLSTDKRRHF